MPSGMGGRAAADNGLIAGCPADMRIADLVITDGGICSWLRCDRRLPVDELHDGRNIEEMLIKSGKNKRLVSLERPADRASELMLLVARLDLHKGWSSSQRAIPQIVEAGRMPAVRA